VDGALAHAHQGENAIMFPLARQTNRAETTTVSSYNGKELVMDQFLLA
jgi:hypothetical protein